MTNNKPQARDISALSAALAKPRQEIEEAFVSVGSRLSEGAAMLNKLTRQFEALPAALQGEEVIEASSQLRAVARTALQLTEDFAKEKADLTRLVEVVSAANSPIGELRRTVKMIGIVSINARVTAAGIVGDNEDFEVFTTDISTLSDSARSTIHEFSQVYRQLVTEVAQAANQRDRFDAAHAHTLTELAHNLDETLEALDHQRQSAVESSAETGRVSRQIVGRIGSAVMALQVGDSTRQRLEHVEAGLDCLADILAGKPVDGATFDEAVGAEALTALSLLEQELLRATAADFAGEVGEAEQALQALASDAGTIMARSRNLYGDGDNEASALTVLSAQLRVATEILRDCEMERSKLEAVAAAVQQTVSILLGHVAAVQDIEANMRLVSLNAAVRCAQLGPRGASLTVIASQLRELTTETVVAAEAAMAQLDEASALAGAFGAAAGGDNAGQIGRLEQQANHAMTLLTRLDEGLSAAMESLNADGPKVIGLLQAAARGIDGQSRLAESMDDIAMQIAGLSSDAMPGEMAAELVPVLERLRKTYTMEAERQIHSRLFGGAVSAPVEEAADDMDLEALMF
ncbi:hypothetical protein JP75_04015 [Devosia riboflavina]|uniref:Methyl-accepting transducer domain-containing protein n=1 Tax=Devosia riboflavina TaxID=46914 RepID=A0A087M5I9_9HYPH|nr:hypothetical protein [Devosia riboflavina]KFL32142.1 hypothetical protein JP75_04015 [Devosia riboflavina]